MYFLTETDPNFRIKGSRDPLGFQSIWARTGHLAVKHLSTVSVNLRDFMILSYAFYFHKDRDPKYFLNFFYKFEQACAFARNIYNGEISFNGIDFVNKKKDASKFQFSNNRSDTLLSNQRAYGIYGKYIRPYRDIDFLGNQYFFDIMEKAMTKSDEIALTKLVNQLLENEVCKIPTEALIPLAQLLKTLTRDERKLYRDYVLKVPGINHPQNNLYDVISSNEDVLDFESFMLHPLIDILRKKGNISPELRSALNYIQHTDRILYQINRAFVYMLSKSTWSKREIIDDPIFSAINMPQEFADEVLRDLNSIRDLNSMLSLDNYSFIEKIVRRNEEVSRSRGNNPWIIKESGYYKVLYGENAVHQTSIDPINNHEFTYFLDSYLNLYKQIEKTR